MDLLYRGLNALLGRSGENGLQCGYFVLEDRSLCVMLSKGFPRFGEMPFCQS